MKEIAKETAEKIQEAALGCLESGLSVLPAIRAQKRPACGNWKTWSERLPTRIEVEAWFANRRDGICIVAGAVSGNLECLDFDNKGELYEAWKAKIDPMLMALLTVERSPSGGYHVLYRCKEPVDGNMKLARGIRDGKLTTLIETRGEGGLFLCCPTEGYVLLQGDFAHMKTIEQDERKALLEAARSFDEEVRDEVPAISTCSNVGQPGGFLSRPGDDFSERGDIRPYLTAAGWQHIDDHPDGNELWRRPGKTSGGHSATFNGKVFFNFSSNAAPFEVGKGYSPFQVYAYLEHRGDFTRAAAALLDKGYGTREEPALGVDFSAFNEKLAGKPSEVQPLQTPEPPKKYGTPIGEIVAECPDLRPVLIHGFLRLGETMNIIAPPKTGKSWLVTDLALSVAMGTDWFGYPCERGRVLIIDNELHKETTASRVPKVIAARGMKLDEVSPWLSVENQRGRLKTIEDIANHIEELKEEKYKLIIIDAFYRAMPRGVDENDNGAIADVYNMLDRYAEQIGCAFVLIHHTSKGNQSQKSVTDVGAGAGAQSRAADTHCILRRHRERGTVVMDSVVRSFQSVPAMCLRWKWPLWNRDESLNPDDLEGKVISPIPQTGSAEAVEVSAWVRKVPSLVDAEHPEPKGVFLTRLQKLCNASRSKTRLIFGQALDLGYIKCEKRPIATDENCKARFVVPGPVDPGVADEGDDQKEEKEDWQ